MSENTDTIRSLEEDIERLEDRIEDNNSFLREVWQPILKNNLDKGNLVASVTSMAGIIKKQNAFINAIMPLIEAERGAQHMLDGFRPQERPIDKILADAKNLIGTMSDGGGDVE